MKKKLSFKEKSSSEGNNKLTLSDNQTTKRKSKSLKKRGRKRKKRAFDETRVGFLLKHEAPLEYELIMEVSGLYPTADLIEVVGYASLNPLFKKPKFRKALISYRQHGLYVKPKKNTPDRELYYLNIRRNHIKELKLQ